MLWERAMPRHWWFAQAKLISHSCNTHCRSGWLLRQTPFVLWLSDPGGQRHNDPAALPYVLLRMVEGLRPTSKCFSSEVTGSLLFTTHWPVTWPLLTEEEQRCVTLMLAWKEKRTKYEQASDFSATITSYLLLCTFFFAACKEHVVNAVSLAPISHFSFLTIPKELAI